MDGSHVFHAFVIRVKNRKKLQKYLALNGIETLIHYPIPIHKQKAFKDWNDKKFSISEKIQNEILSTGRYSYIFNGYSLSSGIYFYELQVDGSRINKKMLLIK